MNNDMVDWISFSIVEEDIQIYIYIYECLNEWEQNTRKKKVQQIN